MFKDFIKEQNVYLGLHFDLDNVSRQTIKLHFMR